MPNVEVKENGKSYTVSVELPGLDEKDVKVVVEDDVLTVTGEKKVERTDEKTHYSERSYGSFTRSFTLPVDADRNAVSARFAKGVLTLEIAKSGQCPDPGQADRDQAVLTFGLVARHAGVDRHDERHPFPGRGASVRDGASRSPANLSSAARCPSARRGQARSWRVSRPARSAAPTCTWSTASSASPSCR